MSDIPLDQPDLHQANTLISKGDFAAAQIVLVDLLKQAPSSAEVHYLLGLTYYRFNDVQAAAPHLQRALELDPRNATYHNTFGVVLNKLDLSDNAIKHFNQAIACNSRFAEAYSNLGNAFVKLQRLEEAVEVYQRALSINPNGYNNLGNVLLQLKRHDEAIAHYRNFLARDPHSAMTLSNLGIVYVDLKQLQTGLHYICRAYELDPKIDNLAGNIALALIALKRIDEAVTFLDQAIAFDPEDERLVMIRAHARLHLGHYRQGWEDYEIRTTAKDKLPRNPSGIPWHGERYDGKRLLVISEQGIGDTIWISRYLSLIKKLGGHLIVESLPETYSLIVAMGIADEVIVKQPSMPPLPDTDYYVYQCSLPRLFSPDLHSIPSQPYMHSLPERRTKFAPALAAAHGKLRIGIIWSGNIHFPGNQDRAAPLEFFIRSFALPEVQLYSLQKGQPAEDLQKLLPSAPIIDLAPMIDDFCDTAAAVDQLDLIIMTDTSTAHLASALGKPVWLLLNYIPHWLWRSEGDSSPWYPAMRIFRAPSWNDWVSVFDQATIDLLQLCQKDSP